MFHGVHPETQKNSNTKHLKTQNTIIQNTSTPMNSSFIAQHHELLAQFSLDDLEELSSVLAKTEQDSYRYERLNPLLSRDLQIIRSKVVTRAINESPSSTNSGPVSDGVKSGGSSLFSKLLGSSFFGNATSTNSSNNTNNNNNSSNGGIPIEFIEEEIEVEEEDVESYVRNHIRGYDNKLKSIRGVLTDVPELKIREALICCGGDEEASLDALLSGQLPPRPTIPKRKVKKIVKKKVKKSTTTATTVTTNTTATTETTTSIDEKNTNPTTSNNNSNDLLLVDVSLLSDQILDMKSSPEQVSQLEALYEVRNNVIQNKIRLEKSEIEQLESKLSKHRDVDKVLSHLTSGHHGGSGDGEERDEMRMNRLFLAGELEAINNGEFRLFTFKPERTFANEVSHIHFRVAESEFHRLLTNKASHKVNEVKYIVSPALIGRFERRRAQMAYEMHKKFQDLKPILAFAPLKDCSDDAIMRVARDGYDRKTPIRFMYDHSDVAAHIRVGVDQKLILSLVLAPKQVDTFTSFTVTDTELVLPYYIVQYSHTSGINQTTNSNYIASPPQAPAKGLHEEWDTIQKEAQADKFIDDVQRFYQQALLQKDKTVKMGPIDGSSLHGGNKSSSDMWFDKVYKERAKKEGFILGADDQELPSATSNVSFEFEVDEGDEGNEDNEDEEDVAVDGDGEDGDDVVDDEDAILTDDVDLQSLTEEERRLLEEAGDDDDEEDDDEDM